MGKFGTYLIVLFFNLFIISSSDAQTNFGFFSGLNLAKHSGDSSSENVEKPFYTGFCIGVVLDWKLNKYSSICFEPILIQKGSITKIIAQEPGLKYWTLKSENVLLYVQIPIMAKFFFMTNKSANPYIIVGPALAFNIKSKQKIKTGSYSGSIDTEEVTEEIDIGICFGAGISKSMEFGSLFIEASYCHGLSNIYNLEDIDSIIKNRGLQILGGLNFPL